MSQFVDNHALARDLPEYKQQIHELKLSNAHFNHLLQQYESLDRQIVRIEQGIEHLGDLALDTLKKNRVHMKDQLSALIGALGASKHS